jgi:hypothetical protein
MPASYQLRVETIRGVMAKYAGAGAGVDPDVVAAAAIQVWERVIRKLTPLIGTLSIGLILARSLDINKQAFPWLAAASARDQPEQLWRDLMRSFERRHPADIVAANSALMIIFADILDALIGERLTTKYLLSSLPHECADEIT